MTKRSGRNKNFKGAQTGVKQQKILKTLIHLKFILLNVGVWMRIPAGNSQHDKETDYIGDCHVPAFLQIGKSVFGLGVHI
jgi:hypothetical protein